MTPLRHPRGCDCELHTSQREYARKLKERKQNGEQVGPYRGGPRKADGPMRNEKKNTSRLIESKSGEGVTVHWMPKEGPEWECPVCGHWFLLVDGEWSEPWVA